MSNNWQYLTPYGVGGQGATVQGGGGGGYATPAGYRTDLDARRSMAPRLPAADYPDGYLGTITNRREDRLLDAVTQRLTDRSYQRGVHVGSKIPASDYFWPDWFTPETSLKLEAKGEKFVAQGSDIERLVHMGKTAFTTPAEKGRLAQMYGVSSTANPQLSPVLAARFAPSWT